MGAALWSWFLVGSEGNVRQWSLLARRRFRPSAPWFFLSVQKATLGTGGRCPQARSVLQGHGVLLFRDRPLELRCRAVLKAWEQTARQAGRQTGWQGGRQGGRQADRQAGREAGRQTDRQIDRQTDRQAGRQTDRQPSARSSLRSCFESVGAALWSWFLVGSEGNVRHWDRCPQARSVLQGHGVLPFRNRPLELRCRAVLRAWEQAGRQTGWQGGRQADRQTDRQAGRQTDRQAGRQADRQAGRQTDRQAGTWKFMLVSNFLADVRGICKSRKYGYNSAMCTVS